MITENIFIFRGDSFWSIYIYILARTSQDIVLSGFHPHRRTNILEKDQMKRIHSSFLSEVCGFGKKSCVMLSFKFSEW